MTLREFRERRDAAHQSWNDARAILKEMEAQLDEALAQYRRAHEYADAEHQQYKDSKSLWRIARDFGACTLDQARMIRKLRDGGVQ